MNKTRNLGLLIVASGTILLILLIYFIFFRVKPSIEEPIEIIEEPIEIGFPEIDEPQITPGDRPRELQIYDISQEEPHSVGLEDAQRRAMVFAEFFGTFSSQAKLDYFSNSQLFMTKELRAWSENYIKNLREENPSDEYYKISTRALSTQTIDYDEAAGQAEIKVTTHRSEEYQEAEENNFLQDILVELILIDDDWRVKAVYWQDI